MADLATLSTMPDSTTTGSAQNNSDSRRSRNRRRGRGGVRPSTRNRQDHNPTLQERTVTGGRSFGGQLTRLHPDAPNFVPASVPPPPTDQSQPRPTRHRPPSETLAGSHLPIPAQTAPVQKKDISTRRRGSLLRSTAADITTRTHEDIAKGVYECAICTNEVSRNSKIWSCRTCWTVFHIGCIKKWSKNEGATVQQQPNEDGALPGPKQWRCPGCNLPKGVLPTSYTCWCEKELDPKTVGGLPPHSCGQTCARERTFPKKCPHRCDLICHAGPCPPCSQIGPVQSCFCGKSTNARKCTETDYETGWSCGQPCNETLACSEHACPRPCHEGLCGSCEFEVEARCYCGKMEKRMKCCDRDEEKESYAWTGSFDCGSSCGTLFDCAVEDHRCEKGCHPQDEELPHCPRSPDMVMHCPCGKTSLSKLFDQPRKSCKDPIPNCSKACGRSLPCGHKCLAICHSEECLPCLLTVPISCRCGRNTFDTVCHQGKEEPPQCLRVCKASLNCGRHECGERCCTGERKAMERQATKRKLKPLGVDSRILDENIEAEHVCTRPCNRRLKCGNHDDPELCHKGPCGSCKEAIFEDISCSCGRTILQAPLPCGTKPPPCNFPCTQPKTCGHPQVAHNCHGEEEECPKCPFLTEKACLCGKKTLKNQPCWRSDVLCGLICGRKLRCGSHYCQKLCHKPGECEDAQSACQQVCSKPKKSCGHPHEAHCHAPSACKEDKSCPFKIIITCDCQRRKEEVRCNARAFPPHAPGTNTASTEAENFHESRLSSLKCDDECARLQRNRNLAQALHISDTHEDDHVPYSTTTLNMYLEDITWSHKQEETLRLFAADETQKRLRFKPMKKRHRMFIHSIAEDFGFDDESIDPEPHRHVLLFKTPKFVAAPMKTLAQAARIKRAALNVSAPVQAVSNSRANEARHTYNGFLITKPKFALTLEELKPRIRKAAPTADFDIIFKTSSDSIALLPSKSWETPEQLTTLLSSLQPMVSAELVNNKLARAVALCVFDTTTDDPIVLHQQGGLESTSTNGWSQVAAKKAAPVSAPRVKAIGQRPVYTVLGSKLAEAKRKRMENEEMRRKQANQEDVVEDWEQEMGQQGVEDMNGPATANVVDDKQEVVEVA
jgi:transcriptional repressor NF-X1